MSTDLRRTLTAAAWVVALIAVFVQQADAQGTQTSAVTLKRTYRTGAVEKFTTTTTIEMSGVPGMTGQRATVTADMTMTYGQIDAGTADVTSVTSNMRIEGLGNQLPPDLLPTESRSNGKIDAQNMLITLFDQTTANGGALAGLSTGLAQSIVGDKPVPQGVGLPLTPVSPGDKWRTAMGSYEALGLTGDIENTFVGETVFEGKPAYRITFEGHFKPGNNPAPENPLASIVGVMTIDVTGEALLDKADCSILSTTTTGTSKTSLSLGGQTVNMDQKTSTIQKRVQ